MTEAHRNVSILHGDDEYGITQECSRRLAQAAMEDPSGMNISRLEGRQSSEEDLRTALNTLPFLSSQRVVVLEELPPGRTVNALSACWSKCPPVQSSSSS